MRRSTPGPRGNKLDRRAFLAAATAAAAGGLYGPRTALAQPTPRRGGRLRLGLSQGSSNDTLDPRTFLDTNMYTIGFTLGNALVELTPEKEPVPELAESWEVSNDSRKWVFRIRQGVTFHNGKPLTPADVVYSLRRQRAEESRSLAKAFLADVTDIRADGQNVVIELANGDADIPTILAVYQLPIIPEGWDRWDRFMGTGAYVLQSFQPGGKMVAVRNRDYWKENAAWYERVEMETITDRAVREEALVEGLVDAIENVNFLTFDRYRNNPDFTALETQGARFITTVMDVRKRPFDDVNVREAMKYAVSRQDIIDKVIGYAVQGNDHPVPPSDPFFHSELPQREFDPRRARRLLSDAGLDSLNVALHASEAAFTGGLDTAIIMQDAASLGNINLRVKREEADGYWSRVWMQQPYVESFWTLRPTPAMMFTVAFSCGSPSAEAYWCDDRFTTALTAAKVETDFNKRKQHFWDLQEITSKEGGNIIPAFISDLDIYSNRIAGIRRDGVARLMGFRVAERTWFA